MFRLGCYIVFSLALALGSRAFGSIARAEAQESSTETSAPAEPENVTDESATAIAKKLQNPVADLISVPFQNNTNFGVGPYRGTQDVLNVQPVIPFHLTDDWNLITRTIIPLTWQPQLVPNSSSTFGLGDINLSLFLSPKNPMNGIIWGAGPSIILPTATDGRLGSNIWGAGPSAVALQINGP